MSKTVVRTSDSRQTTAKTVVPAAQTRQAAAGPVKKVVTALASLRLTVGLLVLSVLLVFLGTLAQIDEGLWTVLHKYFRSCFVAWIPLQVLVRFGQTFFGVSRDVEVSGSFPFPGGWLLGGLLLANLLAAHTVRFKLSWKRSGILLLHSGLVVMMLSELITGLFAVEGRMTIEENTAANFAEDVRATELAIIDRTDPTSDDVVVVPDSILRKGGLIRHEKLPFDVEVDRYMVNSSAYGKGEAPPDTPNPATAGDGLQAITVERPEVSGTDSQVDVPSAYVTFKNKDGGQSLGTYLVSVWLSTLSNRPLQAVAVDGKTYYVALRFKRSYKPYTLFLKEFRHDKYIGTDIPKNYSSLVRLTDPTRNEDRDALIRMNEPLLYGGDTFYQADFLRGEKKGTVLQVVYNPGKWMPYISCAMVSGGMLIHFGIHLVAFLRRRLAV